MNFDYNIMALIQSLYDLGGSISDIVFLIFTLLGEKTFMILAISFIYWCINKRLGEYIIISMFASLGVNGLIKDFVKRIRPFNNPNFSEMRYVKVNNALINTEELTESYSFPSAHSQSSTNLFGTIALKFKNIKITLICALLILLVMISRVYLGLHYPTDVICGMIISLIITFVVYELLNRYYDKKILIFLIAILISSISLFFIPSSDTIKTLGFGVGALIGMILEQRYINFLEATRKRDMLYRLLLGLILVLIVRTLFKIIFPISLIFDFIRYLTLGIIAIYVLPLLFKKFKI